MKKQQRSIAQSNAWPWSWLNIQQQVSDTTALTVGDLDVFLTVSSSEPRCLEIIGAKFIDVKKTLLVSFVEADSAGLRKKHDSTLQAFLQGVSSEFVGISDLSVFDYRGFSERVIGLIGQPGSAEPCRIGVDVSCCPKTHLMGLMAALITLGISHELRLYYAPAKYASGEAEVEFTRGEWAAVQIPFLEGEVRPGRQRVVLASLGYEADKARPFIQKYQPEHCFFLVASTYNDGDDLATENAERGLASNKALAADFDVVVSDIARLPLSDVIGVIRWCDETAKKFPGEEVMLFSLGPKTHAIGFVLYSLIRQWTPVIPRLPESYAHARHKGCGKVFEYRIFDVSAPVSSKNLACESTAP